MPLNVLATVDRGTLTLNRCYSSDDRVLLSSQNGGIHRKIFFMRSFTRLWKWMLPVRHTHNKHTYYYITPLLK